MAARKRKATKRKKRRGPWIHTDWENALRQYPKSSGNIHVIWRKNNWEIAITRIHAHGPGAGWRSRQYGLVITNPKEGNVQYPIRHDDGLIAWDWPESVPKYVQEATVKAYEDYLGGPAYLRRYLDGSYSRY